jgi:hypothetical protein
MKHKFLKRHVLGVSMIEMLGVVAITGATATIGIKGYRDAIAKFRSMELQVQAFKIASAVKDIYTGSYVPEKSDVTDTLYNMDVDVDNPFSGEFSITLSPPSADVPGISGSFAAIGASNLPAAACIGLVSTMRKVSRCTSVNGSADCIEEPKPNRLSGECKGASCTPGVVGAACAYPSNEVVLRIPL